MRRLRRFVGTIEEVVENTRLVDGGVRVLERFARNAPLFVPERRRFLRRAAVLAALFVTGRIVSGCTTNATFEAKTYNGWENFLLQQDLVRGPVLWVNPVTSVRRGFQAHLDGPNMGGWGAVDYEAPPATPVVPTACVRGKQRRFIRHGGNALLLTHKLSSGQKIQSDYMHLSRYTKQGRDRALSELDMSTVVAFSGMTETVGPHLHFALKKPGRRPGLNPFETGIDGGRPVYWDGTTKILTFVPGDEGEYARAAALGEVLDSLGEDIKDQDELDRRTARDVLARGNDPDGLREYLDQRVFRKKSKDGIQENYEFMPGSFMYALTLKVFNLTKPQEFTSMLPFIFPLLKHVYQDRNPDVTL